MIGGPVASVLDNRGASIEGFGMGWRAIAEWIGFQAVWLACALGAAQGRNGPGIVAAAVFLAAVLAGRGSGKRDVGAILASGAVGTLGEGLIGLSGLVTYAATLPGAGPLPPWIIALWLAFGATLPALDAVVGKPLSLRAALLGAVAGPLAYLAGARLGALHFLDPVWPALLALAGLWALALPLLLHLRQRVWDRPAG